MTKLDDRALQVGFQVPVVFSESRPKTVTEDHSAPIPVQFRSWYRVKT